MWEANSVDVDDPEKLRWAGLLSDMANRRPIWDFIYALSRPGKSCIWIKALADPRYAADCSFAGHCGAFICEPVAPWDAGRRVERPT